MSPVLVSPVLPSDPASIVSLFLNPEFRTALKGFVIDLVKEDIDFRESIREAIDYSVATSDLKILQRISTLESMLIADDLNFDDEEHIPTIPEQIKELSNRIEQPLNNSPTEPNEATPVIETIRDMKTCALVEYLKTEAKPNDFGQFVIDMKELVTFLTAKVSEELRVKKVSRQLKADLFERAVKLFPDIVYIKKSPSGNKTKMLALKESAKRTITHGLTRKAPLGILV